MDPRNNHEKKCESHKIPTRKHFEPTNYPRVKLLDLPGHDDTRPTEFSTLVLHTLLSEDLIIEKLQKGFIAYITTYIDREINNSKNLKYMWTRRLNLDSQFIGISRISVFLFQLSLLRQSKVSLNKY